MSAFIVTNSHITAMLDAALLLDRYAHGLNYYHDGQRHHVDDLTATQTGAMLLRENIESVSHRYPDLTHEELPGPVATVYAIDYEYRPSINRRRLSPVEVLKAVRCYMYQACEHPAWQESEAKAFCDALTVAAIVALPGYDEAAWEID